MKLPQLPAVAHQLLALEVVETEDEELEATTELDTATDDELTDTEEDEECDDDTAAEELATNEDEMAELDTATEEPNVPVELLDEPATEDKAPLDELPTPLDAALTPVELNVPDDAFVSVLLLPPELATPLLSAVLILTPELVSRYAFPLASKGLLREPLVQPTMTSSINNAMTANFMATIDFMFHLP